MCNLLQQTGISGLDMARFLSTGELTQETSIKQLHSIILRFGVHPLDKRNKLLWNLLLSFSPNIYWAKRITNLSIIFFKPHFQVWGVQDCGASKADIQESPEAWGL